MKNILSAIIITRNEELMISDCLKSLAFADEIIVVDTGNTDKTNAIARKFGANVVPGSGKGYSEFRNNGIKHARGNWILFIDADERVTQELSYEIKDVIQKDQKKFSCYLIPRRNNYLGKFMNYGGWGGEKIPRLFYKMDLIGYVGDLHEQPKFKGETSALKKSMEHYSHRSLSTMVDKTINFTDFESKLRFINNHPPIKSWRIARVMITEFWLRFIKLQAWRDGTEGVIDGIFQVFNMFVIYVRLWELQYEKSKSTNS